VHLKQSVELRTQFATSSDIERGHRTVEESQPYPIPEMEFKFPVIAIVLQLVMILRLLEPLPDLAYELVALHELL
jgi:hypothetical protein